MKFLCCWIFCIHINILQSINKKMRMRVWLLLLQGNLTAVCSNEVKILEIIEWDKEWIWRQYPSCPFSVCVAPDVVLSVNLWFMSAVILILSEVSQVSVKKVISHSWSERTFITSYTFQTDNIYIVTVLLAVGIKRFKFVIFFFNSSCFLRIDGQLLSYA